MTETTPANSRRGKWIGTIIAVAMLAGAGAVWFAGQDLLWTWTDGRIGEGTDSPSMKLIESLHGRPLPAGAANIHARVTGNTERTLYLRFDLAADKLDGYVGPNDTMTAIKPGTTNLPPLDRDWWQGEKSTRPLKVSWMTYSRRVHGETLIDGTDKTKAVIYVYLPPKL